MNNKTQFLNIIAPFNKILIISSTPIDNDCIGSGLLLKKYLENLKKDVQMYIGRKPSTSDYKFHSHLPYFDEINFKDTRDVIADADFDCLILLDGASKSQFFDAMKTEKEAPNFGEIKNIILFDHHNTPEEFETIFKVKSTSFSCTAELLVSEILEVAAMDENMATLAYWAIMGDTGNYKWGFTPKTFEIASVLVQKKANCPMLIDKVYNSTDKQFLEAGKFVLSNITFNDSLESVFLFLDYNQVKASGFSGDMDLVKNYFNYVIAGKVLGYNRGFLVYEPKKEIIKVTARGNNFKNKLDLSVFLASFGDGGGHFNASGLQYLGNFEEFKFMFLNKLKQDLSTIESV